MENKSHKLSFLFAAVVLSVVFANPFKASAQTESFQQNGVRIRPALIQEKVDPGQNYNSYIKVTNLSLNDQIYYLSTDNITGLSSEGQPVFAKLTGQAIEGGMDSWIKLPDGPITVKSGETLDVPFALNIPTNASPGGHFGAIFVSTKPDTPKETGTAVGFVVGTLLNLRISGDIVEDTQIREFRIDKTIYNNPNANFYVRVENLGNTLSRPVGFVEITDMFGKKIGTVPINNQGNGIFPKQIREFAGYWQGEGFKFGRFTATLSLVYGDEGKKTITSVQTFWVLPIKPIATFFGIILGIIILAIALIRMYIKRKLNEALVVNSKGAVYQPVAAAPALKSSSFSRLAAISSLMIGIIVLLLLLLFIFFA